MRITRCTVLLSVSFSLVVFSIACSACGSGQLLGPTFTPAPTNTPTHTYTPTPTDTPTPTLTPPANAATSRDPFRDWSSGQKL
jgi:hypothetical protein